MARVCVHAAVTPPDLMDPGAKMWHPTLRKSSCSSCSQGSFSEAATPKGCNHERWEIKHAPRWTELCYDRGTVKLLKAAAIHLTHLTTSAIQRKPGMEARYKNPAITQKTIVWHLPQWNENVLGELVIRCADKMVESCGKKTGCWLICSIWQHNSLSFYKRSAPTQ